MGAPEFSRFEIVPVGDGVWAAIGNRSAGVASNAGIVDLGNATLVVDAFLTIQGSEELRTAARLLTGRDPSVLVNTHWHLDHTLGNSQFGDSEIYSTAATRDRFLEQAPGFLPEVHGDPASARMKALDMASWSEPRPLFREEMITELASRRDLYEAYRSLQVRAPNQTYEGKLNLPARRSAWFVEVRGHTESDTMVFVPEAEVLFAGDIVCSGTHPHAGSGDLRQWSAALDGVEKIAPQTLVPGHGPVGRPEATGAIREYLATLRELEGSRDPVTVPDRFSGWLSPSVFDQNLAFVRSHPVRR
jgi:glyoxylase-like metal-dependent hydrolase (beta-lactamase superfamily II)